MVSVEKRTVSKVVFINRSSRAGKGGPHFSFGVLVVVGDGCGRVGLGWGKAKEVASALYKAEVDAPINVAKATLQALQNLRPRKVAMAKCVFLKLAGIYRRQDSPFQQN